MGGAGEDDLKKFKDSFKTLNSILDTFKNSKASDLPKDLKFYRTVYGKVVSPALNGTLVQVHSLQEQLNDEFLPKKYAGGSVKVFNNHQLEMFDAFLDPLTKFEVPQINLDQTLSNSKPKPTRNKFLELQQNSSKNKNVIKPKTNKIFTRSVHPYADAIDGLKLPFNEMYAEEFDEVKFRERSLESVPLHWVDTEDSLNEMYEKLKGEAIIAVDLEHHSFHSYLGLVSLIQISSRTEDFLVDPIRLRESLQSPEFSLNCILADPRKLKLFHGAESDIAWLQRDFDTFVVNMFDSFHAAKLLNLPRMSLAFLLEQFCGVELDKKYQLADWRERPMPEEMIEYARKDTHYLHHLYFLLKSKLNQDQFEQVLQRSNKQCLELYAPEPISEKSWRTVLDRSNYALNPDQVAIVRRLFYWREWKSKELDVSPPALMPNSFISKIANAKASTVDGFKACLWNVSDLLSKSFKELEEYLQSEETKEDEFVPVVDVKVKLECEVKSEHIRFEDEEQTISKDVQFEDAANTKKIPLPKRISRVSFVKSENSNSSGAADIFQSSLSTTSSGKTLLASLVLENLPKIEPEAFITREKEAADKFAAEIELKAAEEAKKEVESVKAVIHGSNKIVENLELASGGSNSTVLADKLRKNVQSKKNDCDSIVAVDYSAKAIDSIDDEAGENGVVFDPYNTIRSEKKRAFIEAIIAGETAPRLSSTRMSGNRMASFTKKRK